MPKAKRAHASEEYVAFEQLTDRLLAVPKAVLDERVKAHKERAALNPNKRGPKPKVKPFDVPDAHDADAR